MNSLSFDDPSLDNLDPTLSLNDPSDIDTALLSDIDGKKIQRGGSWRLNLTSRFSWLVLFYGLAANCLRASPFHFDLSLVF